MSKQINFLTMLFILVFAATASAHPLGNFSVNQFSRLDIEKSEIKIYQVLDLAEIPTFQASSEIDTNKDSSLSQDELDAYAAKITPNYTANLFLSVNDSRVDFRPTATEVSLREGEGNLRILKIIWHLTGDLPHLDSINRVRFENKNNPERIGWNEIVVNPAIGIGIFNSTAFGNGISDELREFPQESLSAPLAERKAEFSFTTGALPPEAKALQNRNGQIAAPVQKDKFAELINGEITFPVILAGLLLAFGFGAAHAMSPGHGKTVVGAYLVGSRGTVKHAVFLGLTVTITHTLSVFAIGIVALFASNYILPERLMPFFSFVSGLLVFFIGMTLFKERLFSFFGWSRPAHHHENGHSHDEEEGDFHTHDGSTHTHGGSTHSHAPPRDVTWGSLLGLGISGGLLPCPSALVLMLSAINLNRIGYGLVLTLVFSIGLATTLTCIGLAFLYAGKFFDSPAISNNRIVKMLPVFSAFVIVCLGAVICYESLR